MKLMIIALLLAGILLAGEKKASSTPKERIMAVLEAEEDVTWNELLKLAKVKQSEASAVMVPLVRRKLVCVEKGVYWLSEGKGACPNAVVEEEGEEK